MIITGVCLLLFLPAPDAGADQPCLDCHPSIQAGETVHAALGMGCESCHSAVDASGIPHKKKNKIAKGLSAEQPDLCYGCHDRAPFDKKVLHAAVGMGCTGCHNPHASANSKLLVTAMPELCYTCHDKAGFTKKTVHPPVAAGECLTCHQPHSGDNPSLLSSPVPELCLMCHDGMTGKHVMAGYGLGNHPVTAKPDPSRPGRELSCTSCHNPHSSNLASLFASESLSPRSLCLMCHKKIMAR